jgi:hypothetical protein
MCDRGLQAVLAAACVSKSPVRFEFPPKAFDNATGGRTVFQVVGGQAHWDRVAVSASKQPPPKAAAPSPSEEEEEEEHRREGQAPPDAERAGPEEGANESTQIEYDREISITNRTLDVAEDDAFYDDIIELTEHLRENVGLLYNCQVLNMHLKFGVKDDGHIIDLLDGSVTTTMNAFTANLFEDVPGGEDTFNEFISEQLAAPCNCGRTCVTAGHDCLRADYKCPRMFVILYRAHERFPEVNEARLYRVLKARFQMLEPDISRQLVNVCICCLHVYTAEERIYQGQKAANELPKLMEPPQFEALLPAELSVKGKRDVGQTRHSCDPHCYMINLRNSPYARPPLPHLDPRARTSLTPIRPIPTSEAWATRLYHSAVSPSIKCVEERTGQPFRRAEWKAEMTPLHPTGVGHSERLAPAVYMNGPFTYQFLESVRLRANRDLLRVQKARK